MGISLAASCYCQHVLMIINYQERFNFSEKEERNTEYSQYKHGVEDLISWVIGKTRFTSSCRENNIYIPFQSCINHGQYDIHCL